MMSTSSGQPLVAETLARMDEGWAAFQQRLQSMPRHLLEVRIEPDGWTRKQMLGHLSAWHDLTLARLTGMTDTGQPKDAPDEGDAFNARAARAAIGRTSGEVVLDLDHSYRQLRRKVSTLTDADLTAHHDWAAAVIAGNTYGHYSEHIADLSG
jgi:hypothetical protein